MTELERCEAEIRGHEANLRAGHNDVAGLFRALIDWRAELRLLVAEKAKEAKERSSLCEKNKEKPPTVVAGGGIWGE